MSIYRLEEVTKQYGARRVLDGINLEVQPGEVLAIVGPSGSGKSTLLRLLNFLDPPTAGRIRFQESEFSATRDMPLAVSRRVTMVAQRPILLDRSVEANVRYPLSLRHRRDSAGACAAASGAGRAGRSGQTAGAHALRRRGAARGAGTGHGHRAGCPAAG